MGKVADMKTSFDAQSVVRLVYTSRELQTGEKGENETSVAILCGNERSWITLCTCPFPSLNQAVYPGMLLSIY
jgi:hypothetical protein